jgi:Undecaprenyl-phosphate galactose phosphotransferase WbaP
LPTLQLGESTDQELPSFSASGAMLQLQRMSGERRHRQEAGLPQVSRLAVRATRPNFRVIEQDGPFATGMASAGAARANEVRPVKEALKRAFDVLCAVLLGIVFSPLMVVVAVLLHREGGPIIFRHRRIGRHGIAFDCLKFRSMVPDADRVLRELLEKHPEFRAEWLRDHKLRDDPRVTAVGAFLRRTSLDELPQLWNVIRGEMSLVGPRPVVREELLRYGRCACVYLAARPGVTGLWQVNGRNNTDYRRRVVLDVYYVRRQNLMLDLYILCKTTYVVLGGSGAY